jgi:VWFA-related protein
MKYRRICGNALRRLPGAILATLLCAALLTAHQQKPEQKTPPVVRVTTRLVVVDVVATTKAGQPVPDLSRDDFTVLERGKLQRVQVFSQTQMGRRAEERKTEAPPTLPLHVYTNRPEYNQQAGTPTILLLDGLNTAVRDQFSAKLQLLRYLDTQIRSHPQLAIMALSNDLILLQDFSSDPEVLRAALRKATVQKSVKLSQGEPRTLTPIEAQAMAGTGMLQAIERFNKQVALETADERVRMTMQALRAIARQMAGYHGRKNLLWISASFPFALLPVTVSGIGLPSNYTEEMRRTAAMLSDAQISLYPVDAHGLVGVPDPRGGTSEDMAATFSKPVAPDGGQIGPGDIEQHMVADSSQLTMAQLASETGGLAFYNRNDISQAVSRAIEDGSRYYTLGYYPDEPNPDGKYRKIEVRAARKGVRLRYRRGYFAMDSAQGNAAATDNDKDAAWYKEVVTVLGDPMPDTAVTFRAYIPPPAPANPAKVEITFLVDPAAIAFQDTGDGHLKCGLNFAVFVLTPDGKTVTSSGKTTEARLPKDAFDRVEKDGFPFHMQVELEPGNYQVRLAVRDNRTGAIGTLSVPLVVQKP